MFELSRFSRYTCHMETSYSSSTVPQVKYDVFISFRGEDTRDGFTSHLYAALCRKKILAYIDYNLEKGNQISRELLKAIEESSIAIVIFSKNYASSTWCLDELAHILKCHKTVIPVFYGVDPSHVRHQKQTYEEAFSKDQEHFKDRQDMVNAWREALKEAANLSGFHSEQIRPESNLVEKIVEHILKILKRALPGDLNFRGVVGLENRIKEIESMLCIQSPNVRILGLWGLGGIGKTTLATVVFYKLFSQFEGCCFISNVREESEKHRSLSHLREKLLSQLLEEESLNMETHSLDSNFSRKQLLRKRVLIVLDDVSDSRQLDLLIGEKDHFGPKSRVIVTTRDVQVLRNGADVIYKVEELSSCDAHKLFLSHAVKRSPSTENHAEWIESALHYAGGVPLAIKVLGSFLHCKSTEEWKSSLNKLGKHPNLEIQNVLKISYDGLDDEERKIFLDIACLFVGKTRSYVESVLDSFGFSATIGIRVLIDKCLIAIEDGDKLYMHDLIKQMGQDIVQKESTEPGRRSRLWNAVEVYHMFKNNTGSKAVEAIVLDTSTIRPIRLSYTAFSKMYNLRYLKIFGPARLKVYLPQGLQSFPNSLRYLEWDGFPLKYLPHNFFPENLVTLKLPNSQLEQLWKEDEVTECSDLYGAEEEDLDPEGLSLEKLVSLDLYNSKDLKNLPANINKLMKCLLYIDLSDCSSLDKFPNLSMKLKTLNLSRTAIEVVPSAIKDLVFLEDFCLLGCKELQSLPTSICKLERLHNLNLGHCSKLEEFPGILEPMKNLLSLVLSHTAIKELPTSIENLIALKALFMDHCTKLKVVPSNIYNLKHLENFAYRDNSKKLETLPCFLKKLDLSYCEISEIPDAIGCFSFLYSIHLDGSAIVSLPVSIKQLHNLHILSLRYCKRLRTLPELPLSLSSLWVTHCKSLVNFSSSRTLIAQDWDFYQCPVRNVMFEILDCAKLDQDSRNNIMANALLRFFRLGIAAKLGDQPVDGLLGRCCLMGNEIPAWFSNQSNGYSITITLPPNWCNTTFLGFALCAVVTEVEIYVEHSFSLWYVYEFRDSTGKSLLNIDRFAFLYTETNNDTRLDHVYMFYDTMPLSATNDYMSLSLSFSLRCHGCLDSGRLNVNKCGISLMYSFDDTKQFDVIMDQNVRENLLAEGSEINRRHIHCEPLL